MNIWTFQFQSWIPISLEMSYVSLENLKIEKNDHRNEKQNVEFGSEKRAVRIFHWRKIDVLSTNFNMERSKKWNLKATENCQKKWKIIKFIQFWTLDLKSIFFIWFFIVEWSLISLWDVLRFPREMWSDLLRKCVLVSFESMVRHSECAAEFSNTPFFPVLI